MSSWLIFVRSFYVLACHALELSKVYLSDKGSTEIVEKFKVNVKTWLRLCPNHTGVKFVRKIVNFNKIWICKTTVY